MTFSHVFADSLEDFLRTTTGMGNDKISNKPLESDSRWRMGTRIRQYADGHLLRDDPQSAAFVHGQRARRQRLFGRSH